MSTGDSGVLHVNGPLASYGPTRSDIHASIDTALHHHTILTDDLELWLRMAKSGSTRGQHCSLVHQAVGQESAVHCGRQPVFVSSIKRVFPKQTRD